MKLAASNSAPGTRSLRGKGPSPTATRHQRSPTVGCPQCDPDGGTTLASTAISGGTTTKVWELCLNANSKNCIYLMLKALYAGRDVPMVARQP